MMCSKGAKRLRSAAQVCLLICALGVPRVASAEALNVTLGWDLSPDPTAAGYNVYYGVASRAYTNTISVGNTNYATVSNLVSGVTYYFAATTYNIAGLESDYSEEVSYTPLSVPANVPPTLDPIAGLVLNENAGSQTVELTGISSGSSSENQTLTVSAFSGNTSLIPNPTLNYTSPESTGTLTFTPVAGASGTANMTVMVDDGGTVSNTVIRSFAVTVLAVNDPPTLDPIDNLTIEQDAGPQTVPLSGISAGNSNETQTITITATSSKPGLLPNPVVKYTSPNPTGTLTLTPATNAFGSAVITVVANDGQTTNATTSQSFTVTVNPIVAAANIVTNATITPNQRFLFVLNPPFTNDDRLKFSLDASAPVGAAIVTRRSLPMFAWTPTSEQASTTNVIIIKLADLTTPALGTNLAAKITVLDYLGLVPLACAVEAGQTVTMPLYVASSEGVTNLSFTIGWLTNRFTTPVLDIPASIKISGTAKLQGTNLQVSLNSDPNRVMTGSNLVAQLTFQARSGQPSAFVDLAIANLNGTKPTGSGYAYSASPKVRVVVVNDRPLLEWSGSGATGPLRAYGRVGTNYVLQASANVFSATSWSTTQSYTQTNVVQTFGTDPSRPLLMYRLKQQ